MYNHYYNFQRYPYDCLPVCQNCCVCRGTYPNTIQELAGVQYQLLSQEPFELPTNDPVRFNTLVENTSDYITYDGASGEFTISRPGVYYVSWQARVDGAGPETVISFALDVVGVKQIVSTVGMPTSMIVDFAVIKVTSVPQKIRLVNITPSNVFFSSTPVLANISILHLQPTLAV